MANDITNKEVKDLLIQTMDRLDGIQKSNSRGPGGAHILAGKSGSSPFNSQGWRSDEWPVEQLKALGGSYAAMAESGYYANQVRTGRMKASGIGPALVKMAYCQNDQARKYINDTYGADYLPADYDDEKLEKEYSITSVQKAASFGVRVGGTNERRKVALAEGAGQSGGYLIPPQFQSELLTIEAEESFIEPRAKVLPMNTREVQWPMLDITTKQAAGTSPYFGGILGTWQPEAQIIAETEPQFKQSTWTAWDLLMFSVTSNQLLADNGIGLDALITQLFAQAISWYKEYAYLQGLGAGATMPLGVLNAPATLVQNRSAPNTFKLADAAAMLSHLQVRSWDDACWVMHQSVIPQLIQMVDNSSSNRLVWVSPVGNGASNEGPASMKLPKAFLNGLPIFFTEKLPSLGTKGDVMLIDWGKYVIGKRLDIQIDVSPHVLFRTNQLAWRVIARCDAKPWLTSYLTDASGWQLSPFICLN